MGPGAKPEFLVVVEAIAARDVSVGHATTMLGAKLQEGTQRNCVAEIP